MWVAQESQSNQDILDKDALAQIVVEALVNLVNQETIIHQIK